MEALLVVLALMWFIPIVVAQEIGKKRNRAGWAYGLFLGWLGVLIVSCTSYLPSDAERQVREFAAQRQLNELQPQMPQITPQITLKTAGQGLAHTVRDWRRNIQH